MACQHTFNNLLNLSYHSQSKSSCIFQQILTNGQSTGYNMGKRNSVDSAKDSQLHFLKIGSQSKSQGSFIIEIFLCRQ